MNMKFFGTTAAAALLLTAPAFAATYTFDDFNTAQRAADIPVVAGDNTSTVSGGPGSGFVGDSRTFTAQNTQGAVGGTEEATVLEAKNGFLEFNNSVGARGTGTVTYANVGDMRADKNTGSFFFNITNFDNIAEFSLSGLDGSGNTLAYNETITSQVNPELKFSAITGSDIFDFSNVTSLSFSITSTGTADSVDGALAGIEVSVVPIPASGLLLFGALGGAAALRRRKARKAA